MRYFLFLFSLIPLAAFAGPSVSVQGQLLKPDASPVSSVSVVFKVQIRSPGGSDCLMYEETQTLDMSNSSGYFTLSLNDGTGIRTDAAAYTFARVFQNRGTFSLPNSCTYVSGLTDERKIVLSFNDGGGFESFPAFGLTPAAQAIDSYSVSGFPANSLLRAVDGSGDPTAFPVITPVQSAVLQNLLSSGEAVNFSGSLGGDVTGTQGSTSVEKIRGVGVASGSPTTGQALVYDGTQWQGGMPSSFSGSLSGDVSGGQGTTSVTKIRGVTVKSGTLTAGQSLIYDGSQWEASYPNGFTGALLGDVTGNQGGTVVERLRGISVSASAPSSGEFLKYNGTDWIPALAVTSVAAGTGLTSTTITSTGTLNVDVGTGAGQIVQLDGSARLPAVDGSQLTHLPFRNQTVINAGTSWTVPSGITTVYVELWGGGGGGGGGVVLSNGGAGGGGGGYAAGILAVTPSSTISLTVGAGGTGGNASTAGVPGGNSLFSSLTATGGSGGASSLGSSAGGSGTATDVISGGTGGPGTPITGSTAIGGSGGASPRGGLGGVGGYPAVLGTAGGIPGGGGGGGGASSGAGTKGGNGANGRIVIWY